METYDVCMPGMMPGCAFISDCSAMLLLEVGMPAFGRMEKSVDDSRFCPPISAFGDYLACNCFSKSWYCAPWPPLAYFSELSWLGSCGELPPSFERSWFCSIASKPGDCCWSVAAGS